MDCFYYLLVDIANRLWTRLTKINHTRPAHCSMYYNYQDNGNFKKIIKSQLKSHTMLMTQIAQDIDLIQGQFTASEARDLISALINEKINFHKVQRLGQFIHDDNSDDQESRERILQLEKEKETMKEFIAGARTSGRKIKITGNIQISYED